MRRPVYIAGSGLLCARGDSPEAVATSLWNGEQGSEMRRVGDREFPYFALPLSEANWLKRAEQAVAQVTAQLAPLPPGIALFVASSSFQIGHYEQQGEPYAVSVANAAFSRQLAQWMQLGGPLASISNACISGFSAIEAARSLIAGGQLDAALIIGVELSNQLTLAGFSAMELLSPSASRPFDIGRDGLVLGEAVAAIRLSATPGRWRIAGLRTGIDAYSSTGPDPAGGPIAAVISDCLQEAQLSASEIELIKVQAAGSPGTDLAEANALQRVFGQSLPALISLKSAIGHTLGASGIAELVALLASLDADQIPATAGFHQADPKIGALSPVDRQHRHIKRALLNLIGFGGGLASMIIERP